MTRRTHFDREGEGVEEDSGHAPPSTKRFPSQYTGGTCTSRNTRPGGSRAACHHSGNGHGCPNCLIDASLPFDSHLCLGYYHHNIILSAWQGDSSTETQSEKRNTSAQLSAARKTGAQKGSSTRQTACKGNRNTGRFRTIGCVSKQQRKQHTVGSDAKEGNPQIFYFSVRSNSQ